MHNRFPPARWTWCAILLLAALPLACAPSQATAPAIPATQPAGRAVVLWISLDGFRPDYLDKTPTPFLHQLLDHAAYSRQLTPICPSLTFPSHASQATGVPAGEHGITGNGFYDSQLRKSFSFPDDSTLLQAEPIWMTATRQHLRCAQLDWPLSYARADQPHTAYFSTRYEQGLTDAQRLGRLIEAWKNDADPQPLQLLMCYTVATDSAGHKYGPDSKEVLATATSTDTALHDFFDQALALFQKKYAPTDELYFIITSDHGMAKVNTLVNIHKLLPADLPRSVRFVDGASVCHIFLDDVPAEQRPAMTQNILTALKPHDFLAAYPKANLPAEWHSAHPTRTGDIVVTLKGGYSFSSRLPEPTFTPERAAGPFGMHGYDPGACPDMLTIAIISRYPKPLTATDLGKISALQLHPTVAKLLHIDPAKGATARPLPIETPAGR